MIQIAEPEELLQKGYVFSENYKYAVKKYGRQEKWDF